MRIGNLRKRAVEANTILLSLSHKRARLISANSGQTHVGEVRIVIICSQFERYRASRSPFSNQFESVNLQLANFTNKVDWFNFVLGRMKLSKALGSMWKIRWNDFSAELRYSVRAETLQDWCDISDVAWLAFITFACFTNLWTFLTWWRNVNGLTIHLSPKVRV